MPRSGVLGTYSLPPGTTPQQPNTTITSAVHNAGFDDLAQTFNTPTPIAYGGTGASDADSALLALGAASSSNGLNNYILNPLGTINQRLYVSGTPTTVANQYTLDRWRVVVSGQNLSWTEANNARTFSAPAGGVEQPVEGLSLTSGTYVLSWTGSASATINGGSVANGATVTLTGGTNAVVRFSSGTFSLPKLEKGRAKTDFFSRDIGQELALCQRFAFTLVGGDPICNLAMITAGNIGHGVLKYPQEMRIAPSLSFLNGNAASLAAMGAGGGAIPLSAISLTSASKKQTGLVCTLSISLTQGWATWLYVNTSPIVLLDAEII